MFLCYLSMYMIYYISIVEPLLSFIRLLLSTLDYHPYHCVPLLQYCNGNQGESSCAEGHILTNNQKSAGHVQYPFYYPAHMRSCLSSCLYLRDCKMSFVLSFGFYPLSPRSDEALATLINYVMYPSSGIALKYSLRFEGLACVFSTTSFCSCIVNREDSYSCSSYKLQLNIKSLTSLSERFPVINNLMSKINLRKKRDTLILGTVISSCVVFLLWWVIR